jgi:hypothetical protein
MEDHTARVLHLLGKDPASLLQALCDAPSCRPYRHACRGRSQTGGSRSSSRRWAC